MKNIQITPSSGMAASEANTIMEAAFDKCKQNRTNRCIVPRGDKGFIVEFKQVPTDIDTLLYAPYGGLQCSLFTEDGFLIATANP